MTDDKLADFNVGRPKRKLDLAELLAEGERAGAQAGMAVPRAIEPPAGTAPPVIPAPVEPQEQVSAEVMRAAMPVLRNAETDRCAATTKAQRRRFGSDKKRFGLELPAYLIKALKLKALKEDTTAKAIILRAIVAELK